LRGGEADLRDMEVVAVELFDGVCEGEALEEGQVAAGRVDLHSSIVPIYYPLRRKEDCGIN
jgi:hypothetical protein